MAPDGSWFAARIRSLAKTLTGVGAFTLTPPTFSLLARAGSVGCMPAVAPSGTWGVIAGADKGILWGEAPNTPDRKQEQLLVPPLSAEHKAYHPGLSTDEKWLLASHGVDWNHNDTNYDTYILQAGRAHGR